MGLRSLLAAQTAAAFILFWLVFPIFFSLVTHLGEQQKLDFPQQLAIVSSAALLPASQIRWMFSIEQACEKMAKSYPTPVINESESQ